MSRYVINVLASRDLKEIADYFAQTNLEAGERFFREFNRKCQMNSEFGIRNSELQSVGA